MDCQDCNKIWFMPCLQNMSPEEKSAFDKKISNLRNFSFIIYFLTSLVDLMALMYYTSSVGTIGIMANLILLVANCMGIYGSIRMNLILILCNLTVVLIIIITFILLILMTFVVARGTGYEVVVLMIPTIIDIIFLCAVCPFICKLIKWFDKSKKMEKIKIKF